MTYNQASYIEDAMNGFTMQQTDFPFVCIIVDDASTDGEPEVIQRYLSTYFDLEDEAQYSLDRIMVEDLVWVCNDIFNNIKGVGYNE